MKLNAIERLAIPLPDAPAYAGLSRSEIYRRAKRGEIVLLKCGSRTLVDTASLRAVIANLARAQIRAA